jgi:hypothetical protein
MNNIKLAFRSKECVFVGYSSHHKGYKFLDVSTGRTYISRDVVFDESVFPFARKYHVSLDTSEYVPPSYVQLLAPTQPHNPPIPAHSGSTNGSNDFVADEHAISFDPSTGTRTDSMSSSSRCMEHATDAEIEAASDVASPGHAS